MGKRSGRFILEKALEIMRAMAEGMTAEQQLLVSRLCRGYTTADYRHRDNIVDVGLRSGGSRQMESNTFWEVLGVDAQSPITAVDVLAPINH